MAQIGSASCGGRQSKESAVFPRGRSLACQDHCAAEDLASKTRLGPKHQNIHGVARPETLIKYI